ncbi:MAG: serine/threonine-protein kinase [Coleofasciculaceae cyanobacterium]
MTHPYCSKGHENPTGTRFCLQCGEKLLDDESHQGVYPGLVLQANQAAPRYRIVQELGQGGFGRTYLAQDMHRFEELCVLKEFAPQVQGTYALQKAEELFEREAGVLYKLQHPQIPKFRELIKVKQEGVANLFLVQDFVDGQTYHALLDARKRQGLRFNEAEVMQLLLQILPVLEYIHSLGIIHRDISPDNLMLRSSDGLPILIDFGGVKEIAATVIHQLQASAPTPTLLGKPGYAPLEQMSGGVVGPQSDFYALAATAVVLLTAKEPQQLIDLHTLEWNWRREVQLSQNLGQVLDKMLEPRSNERFSNVREILQALTYVKPPEVFPLTQPPAIEPTQVASPTLAVSPGAVVVASTPSSSFGLAKKILLVFVAIVVAGSIGWLGGNWWIQSQTPGKEVKPTTTPTTPTNQLTPAERERQNALQQRRTNLGIDQNFYTSLVNEAFWTKYPNQRGRVLGTSQQDAKLRAEWDAIAASLLTKIEQIKLSAAARQQLGRYGEADLTRAKAEANVLRLSSRSLYDLADAKFYQQFPTERGQDFLNQPVGQIWQAVVNERLNAIRTGVAFEKIGFEPGTVSKEVASRLNPGDGKAFIAYLTEGQNLEVELVVKGNQKALLSMYSPTGKTTFLEDSDQNNWSGLLPETGFYEFVVISDDAQPLDYQLNLKVEVEATPEPTIATPTPTISPLPTISP